MEVVLRWGQYGPSACAFGPALGATPYGALSWLVGGVAVTPCYPCGKRVFLSGLGRGTSLWPHSWYLMEHVRARIPGRQGHD